MRRLAVDLPAADGGTDGGAAPGELMQAALTACLAIACRVWAARLDIPLADLEVELAVDFDTRGHLLRDSPVPAGWRRLVIIITAHSSASPESLAELIAIAQRHSPVLACLSPAIERVLRLTVVAV